MHVGTVDAGGVGYNANDGCGNGRGATYDSALTDHEARLVIDLAGVEPQLSKRVG